MTMDDIMTNYKVENLNSKTPEAEQNKLKTNLKGMQGVQNVNLNPTKGEFSLSCGSQQGPNESVIKAAVQKAGFTLGSRSSAH